VLGPGAAVGTGLRLELGPRARLILGAGAWLGSGTRVEAEGTVTIGAHTLVGARSVLIATSAISVGDDSVIGDESLLRDNVRVGNAVRIGTRACLLPGADVGDGSVVVARSVVDRPVAPGTTVSGVPARPDQTRARSRSR
jgi:UDP-3-O-[3-hydroxymyristoyl] glucosamine N-acyltransferase